MAGFASDRMSDATDLRRSSHSVRVSCLLVVAGGWMSGDGLPRFVNEHKRGLLLFTNKKAFPDLFGSRCGLRQKWNPASLANLAAQRCCLAALLAQSVSPPTHWLASERDSYPVNGATIQSSPADRQGEARPATDSASPCQETR